MRIGLALHGLHGLAYEEAEQFVLTGPIFRNLVLVRGHDLGDFRLNRALIVGLLQALFFDDGRCGLPRFELDF